MTNWRNAQGETVSARVNRIPCLMSGSTNRHFLIGMNTCDLNQEKKNKRKKGLRKTPI